MGTTPAVIGASVAIDRGQVEGLLADRAGRR
jgi:hypothetical protein